MIKIKYPKNINDFHNDYLKIFNFNPNICINEFFPKGTKLKTLNEILLMPINEILEFKILNDFNLKYSKEKLEEIFKYEKFQTNITKFFMKYQKELELSTCYFCNINYIYSFENNYCNDLDFMLYASKKELEEIKSIGEETSKKLIAYRNNNQINTTTSIPKHVLSTNKKIAIKNHTENMKFNHFTLDHLLSQSENPLFALSLYNLVPSCSTCNSKFKHTISLVKDVNDLKFIPTYKKINFDKNVKFKLFFNDECKIARNININKLKIILKSNDLRYAKFISTFKLYNRYQNHSHFVEEMIQKKKKYSETYIKNISEMLDKPQLEVKKDIFGKEIFEGELSKIPLTKLKRDIWEIISNTNIIF